MKKQWQKLRRLLSLLFLALAITNYPLLSLAKKQEERLKAGIKKEQKKNYVIQVLPETILSTELNLEGDYFSGYLSEDSAAILGVPLGSKLSGKITKIKTAKSLQRAAAIDIDIDSVVYPNGESVKAYSKLQARADKQGDNQSGFRRVTKKVIKNSTEIGASTLVGAVDAVQYTGIGTAIATHGISAGIGAGLGLGLGIIGALTKKGQKQSSSGFKLVGFNVIEEFKFLEAKPLMTEPLLAFDPESFGIGVKVNKITEAKYANMGELLLLDIELKNNSSRNIFGGDFVLSSKEHPKPIYTNSLFAQNIDSIMVDEKKNLKLAFSLAQINKEHNYRLQLIDPISEQMIVDFDLDIASYI